MARSFNAACCSLGFSDGLLSSLVRSRLDGLLGQACLLLLLIQVAQYKRSGGLALVHLVKCALV